VLAFSAAAIGIGQTGLAIAPNLATYITAWLVVGAGMGAGLYDADFATLGRLYGRDARSAITTLTNKLFPPIVRTFASRTVAGLSFPAPASSRPPRRNLLFSKQRHFLLDNHNPCYGSFTALFRPRNP
jgi:hypothetical protein